MLAEHRKEVGGELKKNVERCTRIVQCWQHCWQTDLREEDGRDNDIVSLERQQKESALKKSLLLTLVGHNHILFATSTKIYYYNIIVILDSRRFRFICGRIALDQQFNRGPFYDLLPTGR